MGMEASAIIEYWEHETPPDGTRQYTYWGEYFVPNRGIALQLFALTGLSDDQPVYDVKDLSWLGSKQLERDADIRCSKPMKIEGAEVPTALARVKAPRQVFPPLRVALECVQSLGPHARLVFWMTI